MLLSWQYSKAKQSWGALKPTERKVIVKQLTSDFNSYSYRAFEYLPAWLKGDFYDYIVKHERETNSMGKMKDLLIDITNEHKKYPYIVANCMYHNYHRSKLDKMIALADTNSVDPNSKPTHIKLDELDNNEIIVYTYDTLISEKKRKWLDDFVKQFLNE